MDAADCVVTTNDYGALPREVEAQTPSKTRTNAVWMAKVATTTSQVHEDAAKTPSRDPRTPSTPVKSSGSANKRR
eukprot:g37216.t1